LRILVIHQYYVLPGMAGGSRFNELARLWVESGHEVTVIAGNLDYSTGTVPPAYRGHWLQREKDGAVTVWRCRVPSTYNRSYVGRMWAFFGFTLSSLAAVVRAPRHDVIVATSPPLVVALPAWVMSRLRLRRIPWLFEIRDLWPESAVTTGILNPGGLLARLLYALERWACQSADHVNVLTPAFRENLLKRGLASDERISVIPNGADLDQFRPARRDEELRRSLGWHDRFVVLYAGAHGRANAIGQLVDAAELLRERPDILIACVGDGPERERWHYEARRRGLENILFHGAVPKEQMPAVVNACDVGAAVLQKNPTFLTVYPNKVFDYMACGKPVLLAIDGAARDLVCAQAQGGLFAEPESPQALAGGIRRLADDPHARAEMGERGRQWVTAHASRRALAGTYLSLLEGLAGARTNRHQGLLAKEIFDRTLAVVGLVLLAPVMLAMATAILVTQGRPVLFRQTRPGRYGRPFDLVKFRTMREGEGGDDARLTALGRFLRSFSLDELPELWNVLRGEMSLVGPRPLLMKYLERYSPEQSRRHEVKPGITGWAQVNGRNALNWDDKLALDVWYVDNRSLLLDARILARTLSQVVMRRGIAHPGTATMPEFTGSAPVEKSGKRLVS
jgi:lipopolysaccharide/colanic/teichoic acid biosynthesis glycosyltransferase/glycosyltransferase involved in cell wall biosynthesis